MRYIIMHKASPEDEADRKPTPELIAEVSAMIGEMAEAGVLRAGEGLRPSALGVRLRFAAGRRERIPGPFTKGNELLSGFAVVRVKSLDDAVEWASRYAQAVGDCELDIRPLTEPWDIGAARKPAGLDTFRYMIAHKADRGSEAGKALAPERAAAVGRLISEMQAKGVFIQAEGFAPSSQAARLRFTRGMAKPSITDGPFAESKELIGGFVIVDVPSRDDAIKWTLPYGKALGEVEIDVRPLLEQPA
jgi:hypothetical protein